MGIQVWGENSGLTTVVHLTASPPRAEQRGKEAAGGPLSCEGN